MQEKMPANFVEDQTDFYPFKKNSNHLHKYSNDSVCHGIFVATPTNETRDICIIKYRQDEASRGK